MALSCWCNGIIITPLSSIVNRKILNLIKNIGRPKTNDRFIFSLFLPRLSFGKIFKRIYGYSVYTNFKMEVRSGNFARVANSADSLSLIYSVSRLYVNLVEMSIVGFNSVLMAYAYEKTVRSALTCEDHFSAVRR